MTVKSRLVPHVGNTLGFRVSYNGFTVVYIPDHQMPTDGSMGLSTGVRELCEGADLLIHDAQYTPDEFATKNNWGHCTVDFAVWVAAECHVKRLALFHHDPTRSDVAVDALLEQARKAGELSGVDVFAAHEGQSVTFAV